MGSHGRSPTTDCGELLALGQGHDRRTSVGLPRLWCTVAAGTAVEEPARRAAEYGRGADLLSVCTADRALERFESN